MEDNYEVKKDEYGTLSHYKNGILHREDGPAVKYMDGSLFWYIEGELHREDGPAILYCSGTKEWWINGVPHREDGPAIEYFNGDKSWYINDICITKQVEEWITSNDIPNYEEWTNKEIAQFKLKFL